MSHRITKSKDYSYILKNGKRLVSKNLIIIYLLNSQHTAINAIEEQSIEKTPVNRFGFIASRKVGKAVVRNKIKRRLKNAVTKINSANKGFDVCIIAKQASVKASFKDVYLEIEQQLNYAKII